MALSNRERQAKHRAERKRLAQLGLAAAREGATPPIQAAPERHRHRVDGVIAAELQRHRADVRRLTARVRRCRGEERATLEREVADADAMVAAWGAVWQRLVPGKGESEPSA